MTGILLLPGQEYDGEERRRRTLRSHGTPRRIFVALDDVGSLLVVVAVLFAAPVFDRRERIERLLRWLFVANFLLIAGSLVVVLSGSDPGCRDEVVVNRAFELAEAGTRWRWIVERDESGGTRLLRRFSDALRESVDPAFVGGRTSGFTRDSTRPGRCRPTTARPCTRSASS